MSKELEAYNELKTYLLDIQNGTCHSTAMRYTDTYAYLEQNVLNVIEEALKALEIIKETWKMSFFDEEQTITIDNCYSLTFYDKDKYNLLKEVLL